MSEMKLGVQKHIHTVRLTAARQIEVTILDAQTVTMTPKEAVALAKSLKRIAKPAVERDAALKALEVRDAG